ncbi:MAG: hypothetical protein WDW38_005498 [Sanguina aurantia]
MLNHEKDGRRFSPEQEKIASKIGQLYYNFYLRNAETRYLLESYTFYQAIHSRHYFQDASNNLLLACKELHFFARYIVVCLLLNKREDAYSLLQEFQAQVTSYLMKYKPQDAAEWQAVVTEVDVFLHADVAIPLPRSPGQPMLFKPNLRCQIDGPIASLAPHIQRIKEVIFVAAQDGQVKIAELPLDSYRMMQTLEWHDARLDGKVAQNLSASDHGSVLSHSNDITSLRSSLNGLAGVVTKLSASSLSSLSMPNPALRVNAVAVSHSNGGTSPRGGRLDFKAGDLPAIAATHPNPAKHLIYRPNTTALLNIIVTSVVAMAYDDILLLHLSADGPDVSILDGTLMSDTQCPPRTPLEVRDGAGAGGSGGGGAEPRQPRQPQAGLQVLPDTQGCEEIRALHLNPSFDCTRLAADELFQPEDILPFTRRQILLIVDSDISTEFKGLQGREVGRPLLCLMSATALAPGLEADMEKVGSLFSMALSCPLMAMCTVCGERNPSLQELECLQTTIDSALVQIGEALLPELPTSPWGRAFDDVLLRQHILRFILFRAAMDMLPSTTDRPELVPSCYPPMPEVVDPDGDLMPQLLMHIERVFAVNRARRKQVST